MYMPCMSRSLKNLLKISYTGEGSKIAKEF